MLVKLKEKYKNFFRSEQKCIIGFLKEGIKCRGRKLAWGASRQIWKERIIG